MPDDGRPGVRHVEFVMGMPVVVDLRDDAADDADINAVLAWLHAVDDTFSTYKEASEISRINRGELALADAHPDVIEIAERCAELRTETNGFFDATFDGTTFDPSGLVKGWSVDRAAAILDQRGLGNYAVNAGGDLRLRGGALPDDAWRVGIQHPHERSGVAAVVEGRDLAVATSGEYARGQHVLDPHTREPPAGVLSVTITGPDLATADAYATAAFAMGADRVAHWTARLKGYEAMTILADGRVLSTPGFPRAADGVTAGEL
jgi:thiamine biosynthesis lipoprotein